VTDNLDTTYLVEFSGPITIDGGVTPDGAWHVAESVPNAVDPNDANSCILTISGPSLAGQEWALDAQPNWLLTAASIPETGTIT
jgi:hypothetical protein